MFISDATLTASFQRLKHRQNTGKKGLERTSALMYFLAFDQLAKSRTYPAPLDMDPETEEGRYHRKSFAYNFAALVTVQSRGNLQIAALGEVKAGNIPPEKKVSANFLTVPLTKAAQAQAQRDYPSRPVPLLKLGKSRAGMTWGVDYHPDWRNHLGMFLMDTGSKTPFVDLAFVVLRAYEFGDASSDASIKGALGAIFTPELTEQWMKCIEFERVKAAYPSIAFQENLSNALENPAFLDFSSQDASGNVEAFQARVSYLESLLVEHGIEFDEEER